MSVEIVMPKLSDTMEEGTILRWLKQVGDQVARGDVIAEVETDKADMELEASAAGVLREIKVQEGQSAVVGAVLALVDEGGNGAQAKPAAKQEPDAEARSSETAGEAKRAEPAKAGARTAEPAKGGKREAAGRPQDVEGAPAAAAAAPGRDADPKATPAARQLATERGVDLSMVRGSGPGGRIVSDDVAHAPGAPRAREPEGAVAGRQELSRMRQSIARRMSEAFRDIPHFYVTAEIDMGEAARLKDSLAKNEVYVTAVTYTHMVLKATALALKRHPRLNASFRDDAIELKGEINLGMAVAVEDGLIVPVLRAADERPLGEIASEARRLVEQARRGRFAKEDLSGGTFTVSNMGMLDLEEFAAVINPPQAAILAVGAVKERAVVRDGTIVVRPTMRVTVSCDHRIIDGVVAGRFLEELKRLLENPIVLVVQA
ncbi:MAG TPA: dihydrolipoamide acetyltransferase family protein [Candidatus Binatia bacterium]|jgi:pyruvate dehydrogenase E2 component (dihydrolipoamide acetyltransferase)